MLKTIVGGGVFCWFVGNLFVIFPVLCLVVGMPTNSVFLVAVGCIWLLAESPFIFMFFNNHSESTVMVATFALIAFGGIGDVIILFALYITGISNWWLLIAK